jgi:hypothetical protein
MTFHKQEDRSAECRAVVTLHFNSALFKKRNHHEVQEYKQDRYVFCNHMLFFSACTALRFYEIFVLFVCYVSSPRSHTCVPHRDEQVNQGTIQPRNFARIVATAKM